MRLTAFRFCVIYISLFSVFSQILWEMLPLTWIDLPDLATVPPMSWIVAWVAAHVFHVTHPLVLHSGSGDKTVDWVLDFTLLVVSLIAAALWSVIDRNRAGYDRLATWFHLFVRFALAGQMFGYGVVKFIPLQMPFPSLTRLVEPFGNFSPMGSLWYSVGAAPGYERFAGAAEILAGILLMLPRTAMLGALVCLADMIQVFMLNMTYDVPVKLFSLQLALLSLYLLAPEFTRLFEFFLSDKTVAPSTQSQLFQTRRANRFAFAGQVLFGVVLIGANAYSASRDWKEYGGGRPKSPLYGIWNMEQFSMDGHPHPLLATDNSAIRRLIFDRPDTVAVQQMDGTFVYYDAKFDVKGGTLALSKDDDKSWHSNLHYQTSAGNRLMLDGAFDGHLIHMELQIMDRNQFLIVNRGFHWIQEYPFNR